MDDQNNWRHAPIYLERTREKKFWPDCNFYWYLAVTEVNTDLASGHFQNDGVVQPSLYFQRYLAIYCLENTIGVELGDNELTKGAYKLTIYVPCEKITVKQNGGMWYPSKKKEKSETEISKAALSEILEMW